MGAWEIFLTARYFLKGLNKMSPKECSRNRSIFLSNWFIPRFRTTLRHMAIFNVRLNNIALSHSNVLKFWVAPQPGYLVLGTIPNSNYSSYWHRNDARREPANQRNVIKSAIFSTCDFNAFHSASDILRFYNSAHQSRRSPRYFWAVIAYVNTRPDPSAPPSQSERHKETIHVANFFAAILRYEKVN